MLGIENQYQNRCIFKGVIVMIYGERIMIRPLEEGDEETLYRWWNDGELMAHAGFPNGILQSKETIRIKITSGKEDVFSKTRRFMICRQEDFKPIGEVNYHDWDARNQKCEIGIKVCEKPEQGKGYGYDALFYFIDFVMNHLNLNKIELTTMKDNLRAQKLYKKLGFQPFGVSTDGYFDSRIGEFVDVIFMELLKKEWIKKRDDLKGLKEG